MIVKSTLPIAMLLLLTGCDQMDQLREKDGHYYIWRPHHFEHDPNCGECQKLRNENDNF
jgi:hypothetical protein